MGKWRKIAYGKEWGLPIINRNKVFCISGFAGLAVGLLLWFSGERTWVGVVAVVSFALLAVSSSASPRFQNLSFTVWVLTIASGAVFYPDRLISVWGYQLKNLIGPLIQVIMLGMGMTLTTEDFKRVLQLPKPIFIGTGLQYGIMPFFGWACAMVFDLPPEVAVGLILVGSSPGGTASNVITYIAGANVPLSVTMTACSTLISPLMTPLAMKILAGKIIPVEFMPLMMSILSMIFVPVVVGILINKYLPNAALAAAKVLPAICMASICLIIGITIAISRDDLFKIGVALFFAAVCHNGIGFGLGYGLARLFGMNKTDARTVSIEVGMQNCGMATGLAFSVLKSASAALPSAVFGPWSAVAGSVLASWWRRNATHRV